LKSGRLGHVFRYTPPDFLELLVAVCDVIAGFSTESCADSPEITPAPSQCLWSGGRFPEVETKSAGYGSVSASSRMYVRMWTPGELYLHRDYRTLGTRTTGSNSFQFLDGVRLQVDTTGEKKLLTWRSGARFEDWAVSAFVESGLAPLVACLRRTLGICS
jgi:hypothetical protein